MFENVEVFYRPASIREALQLLGRSKGRAKIVAGCTDVVAGTKDRSDHTRFLIDITRAGLSYIREPQGRGRAWAVGATTTMAEIEDSPAIRATADGILAQAAATCGSVEIRNMATIGGNMANGSPAADLATPLLALDSTVTIARAGGRRKMALADYLTAVSAGKLRNALLVEVCFPDPPHGPRCGWSFQKLGRTALDISLVNVAAGLGMDAGRRVKWARIAVGAMAPAPIRVENAEALMTGRVLDDALISAASAEAIKSVDPISDVRASAEYRRETGRVLIARALAECASCLGCSL